MMGGEELWCKDYDLLNRYPGECSRLMCLSAQDTDRHTGILLGYRRTRRDDVCLCKEDTDEHSETHARLYGINRSYEPKHA